MTSPTFPTANACSLGWLNNPEKMNRTIDVFRPDHAPERMPPEGVLEGDPVLPGFRLPVAEVCQNLARSGVGVLLIEHNVPMVLSIADTVTCLHQGRRLFQGTPAELRADTSVASVFLGIDEPLEASS